MEEQNLDTVAAPNENKWAHDIAMWADQYMVTRIMIAPILALLAIYNYGLPVIFLIESIKERRWSLALAWLTANIVLYVAPLWALYHYAL